MDSATVATDVPGTVDNASPGLERAWWAVAMAHEVGDERPLAVQLLGRHWALVRIDGRLVAFEDRCPHRLAPLSSGRVEGSVLRCGYHGWSFDATGRTTDVPALGPGAVISPKACATTPWGVRQQHGLVWLAPEEPVCDIPALTEWDDPDFDVCFNEPRRTPVGVHQLVDNFLDATHLPVVHVGTFGVPDDAYVPHHEVVRDGWSVSATYDVPYRNHDDPLVATGEHDLVQPQELHKAWWPGGTAYVRLFLPVTGRTLSILFACQPESATSSRLYKVMARDDTQGDEARLADTVVFEDAVLDEDLAILEQYRHGHLHLDARAEIHTRADRLSVAFRRLLAEQLAFALAATPGEPAGPIEVPVAVPVGGAP